MSGESVKVAVRVRPFNQREIDLGDQLVIEMNGKQTKIKDPNNKSAEKTFTFDYSYWSHDEFTVEKSGLSVPNGPNSRYASQDTVFQDLGRGVLNNALKGYNCSLFAYGQTGSGKSYSMVGYGPNKGIVPITCEELFKIVTSNTSENKKYAVTYSMLEVYNERVRDLLSKSPPPSGGLAVKLSSKLGFYVENLKKVPVGSYKEIEKWMNQGTSNRTIAATQMNSTSSRAHTVITIEFRQIITNDGMVNTLESNINLIDLAGSERADSTGATGDRLKEGANINKSLSALGNVIAALADNSSGKKEAFIPYRDSVLTKLLKNALGGNSKTVMIASLSPAGVNYNETLSTLRYADRAKSITNKATVNENPLEKIIRELREENEKLRKMLNGEMPADINTQGMTDEEIQNLRKQIEEELRVEMQSKTNLMAIFEGSSWEGKIDEAQSELKEELDPQLKVSGYVGLAQGNLEEIARQGPFFVNLNSDPMLSGVLVYGLGKLPTDQVTIGKQGDVGIHGPGVNAEHANIRMVEDTESQQLCVWIKSAVDISESCVIRVNGHIVQEETQLQDGDRVLFGSSNLFIFRNPLSKQQLETIFDWDVAMKEMASAEGLNIDSADHDLSSLEVELIDILPRVQDINAISTELQKFRNFNVLIIPALSQDVPFGEKASPKIMIKMTNIINGNTWLWTKDQFINRLYIIQEVYQKFLEGEDWEPTDDEQDPFWEPTSDILVGQAYAFLQNLSYATEFEHELKIIDYKGREEGLLKAKILPVDDQTGQEFDPDYYLDDPLDLLGKPFAFKILLKSTKLYKPRFIHGSRVSFRVYKYEEQYQTPIVANSLSADFNYSQIIKFPNITKHEIEYFNKGNLVFQVFGIQKDTQQKPKKPNNYVRTENNFNSDLELNRLKTQERILQQMNKQMTRKINRLKELCINWAEKPEEEQKFDSFYKSVSLLAFSSGNKFKILANVIGKTSLAGKAFIANGNAKSDDNYSNDEVKPARITIYARNGENESKACNVM